MRAAVLGFPVSHSLSPRLHRAAYAELGLTTWSYDAIECREEELAAFVGGCGPEWAGLSPTMPLKRVVFPLLDTVAPLAVEVGAANTVIFPRRGAARREHRRPRHRRGAGRGGRPGAVERDRPRGGATAASALAALRELGLREVTLVVRDPRRAGETLEVAARLGMSVETRTFESFDAGVDLLVSTLPSGAADSFAAEGRGRGPSSTWSTRPGRARAGAGRTGERRYGRRGLSMLLHQAVRQVELMTGRAPAPVEAMRSAVW